MAAQGIAANGSPRIIRTERGLTIDGTRTTLYRVIDLVKESFPPKYIRDSLNLTDGQVAAALDYIAANRDEVEAEYQQVLKNDEEIRRYWEERNKDVITRLRSVPHVPGKEALRAKLLERKARRAGS